MPTVALAMGFGNDAPVVDSIAVRPDPPPAGGVARVTCSAHDADGSVEQMEIVVEAGALPGGGLSAPVAILAGQQATGSIDWTTPGAGVYQVTCRVADGGGAFGGGPASAELSVRIEVVDAAELPVIEHLTASKTVVMAGEIVDLRAAAHDPQGAPLAFAWSASEGDIVAAAAAAGGAAAWTAPAALGLQQIRVQVTNDAGRRASASLAIRVIYARAGAPVAAAGFSPNRLAIDAAGNLYVSDARARAVRMYSPLGALLRVIPVGGRPSGVAVDAGGRLYVADIDRGRVAIFDRLGREVGALGAGAGEFTRPLDLAIDRPTGRVYVADGGAGAVRVYDRAGSLTLEIGLGDGMPGGVALLDRGDGVDVYVSDVRAGVIHLFDDQGNALGTVASWGAGPGELTRPAGLTLAPDGTLYVVDTYQSRVGVFRAGAQVASLGTFGDRPGQLNVPLDAAWDPWGRLLVSSTSGGSVQIFEPAGAVAPRCARDADCDGVSDALEIAAGLNPRDAGDAYDDADGDGLANVDEVHYQTDLQRADSDGDGTPDLAELLVGRDPRLAADARFSVIVTAERESEPALIRLDASASEIAGELEPRFEWTQVEGPEPVPMVHADRPVAAFAGRAPGDYRFAVRIGDAQGWSLWSEVEVRVLDVPPRADAGPSIGGRRGQPVRLDGRFSADANGQALAFEWAQIAGPPIALEGADGPEPSFTPAETGVYGFELVVDDGLHGSEPDRTWVAVDRKRDHTPVAAGPALVAGRTGSLVLLRGSESRDTDGDDLTFEWRQLGGPPVELLNETAPVAFFVAPEAGRYDFELIVSDGAHRSAPLEVAAMVHTSGTPPRADAGPDKRVEIYQRASMTCAGSEGQWGPVECRWRQIAGVPVRLTQVGDRARFNPLVSGTYSFELQVADAGGPGTRDTVHVIADAPGDRVPTAVGESRAGWLLGGGSQDAEPGALRYTWSQVEGPRALLGDPRAADTTFQAGRGGVYSYDLWVDDGVNRSPPARVELSVQWGQEGQR